MTLGGVAVKNILRNRFRNTLTIAGVAVASLWSHVVTTLVVLRHHPEPWQAAAAFLMLPVYAVWRTGLAALTLVTLGDTRWRKTRHHASAPRSP